MAQRLTIHQWHDSLFISRRAASYGLFTELSVDEDNDVHKSLQDKIASNGVESTEMPVSLLSLSMLRSHHSIPAAHLSSSTYGEPKTCETQVIHHHDMLTMPGFASAPLPPGPLRSGSSTRVAALKVSH